MYSGVQTNRHGPPRIWKCNQAFMKFKHCLVSSFAHHVYKSDLPKILISAKTGGLKPVEIVMQVGIITLAYDI